MVCFKKSAKRRKMTNFSAIWKTETRGENGRRKFKSFPVFPSIMSVISLALWTRIARLASPMWCQQLLCFYHGISVLQVPQPRPAGSTGCLTRDPLPWWGSLDTWPGTCSDLAQSPHRGVPTPAYSKWSKRVSMAITILIFYHPSWHAWTLNTVFSGPLHSNMLAAV